MRRNYFSIEDRRVERYRLVEEANGRSTCTCEKMRGGEEYTHRILREESVFLTFRGQIQEDGRSRPVVKIHVDEEVEEGGAVHPQQPRN